MTNKHCPESFQSLKLLEYTILSILEVAETTFMQIGFGTQISLHRCKDWIISFTRIENTERSCISI